MFDEQGQPPESPAGRQRGPTALASAAVKWIQQLPRHIQPAQTAAQFPHIANALAATWQTPQACRAYFDQVLLDHRGSRRGFPKAVASELSALKDFYDSVVHPTQQTVWDEIVRHARG